MLLTHRIARGSISDRRLPITQTLPKSSLRIFLAGRGPDFDESDAGIGALNRYTPALRINHKQFCRNRIQIINFGRARSIAERGSSTRKTEQ